MQHKYFIMLKGFQFSGVPDIKFGPGKISTLPESIYQFGKKALIVSGGGSFLNSKKGKNIINMLRSEDLSITMVAIGNEPSPQDIDHIVKEYREEEFDAVISIGGGSVIDSGKAISAMMTEKGNTRDYLEGVGTMQHHGSKVPFIAIPTTSGTGSEATKNAVLSEIGKNGYKKSLRHDNFVPNLAIVDPELTLSCPPAITASSGMDAFTQLLESYVSYKASIMTDSLVFEGLKYLKNGLLPACSNAWDLEARTSMAYASMVSGIALANAGLGIVHGFASSIGGYFNIPHGVVCTALMANAVEITAEKLYLSNPEHVALRKYANVGKIFSDTRDKNDQYYLQSLISVLHDYSSQLNVQKLSEYGVNQKHFSAIISKTSNKMNPIVLEKDDLVRILERSL